MPFKNRLHAVLGTIMDLLAPPRHTEEKVQALTIEKLHELARRKVAVYDPAIHTLVPYRHPAVKALIYEMKYRRNARAIALVAELLREELVGASEDVIGTVLLIPVPMHESRMRERGFNQCQVLCEEIVRSGAGMTPFELTPHALTRVMAGTPQQKLQRKARLRNMHRAMRAHGVRDRVCVVVDDVSTTGATLLECKRALKASGAREVHLLALAG